MPKYFINIYFFKVSSLIFFMLLSSLIKFVKSHLTVRLTLLAGRLAAIYHELSGTSIEADCREQDV